MWHNNIFGPSSLSRLLSLFLAVVMDILSAVDYKSGGNFCFRPSSSIGAYSTLHLFNWFTRD